MMRLIFVFFIAVFFISTLNGQTKEDLNQGYTIPKIYLKTNFTFLINPMRTSAMISTGIKLPEDFVLEIGLGYYINSTYYAGRDQEKYTGPRVQAGYKYFFSNREFHSWFVGLEGRYDWINISNWETIPRQGGHFSEIRLVDKKINSASLFTQFGNLLFVDQKKRFFLEFYLGLGVIAEKEHWDLPEDAMVAVSGPNLFFRPPREGYRYKPRLWMGVNLGYAFW